MNQLHPVMQRFADLLSENNMIITCSVDWSKQRHDQLQKARREIAERSKLCLKCGEAIYKHFRQCGDTWIYHCSLPCEFVLTPQQPTTKTNNALSPEK